MWRALRTRRAAGRAVVFMGDDTWDALFPRSFTRSYPFPSFNVKDLHTVDDGVIRCARACVSAVCACVRACRAVRACVCACVWAEVSAEPRACRHLLPEMVNSTWDVIIAHFLGVDHVGHRFGPSHAAMAAKLDQLNGVLRDVMSALDESTLLVVMGDHGMTPGGNHGGASDEETQAALFLCARDARMRFLHGPPILHMETRMRHVTACRYAKDGSVRGGEGLPSQVQQVDLVPTLALLLGAPVPFGNLGAAIPHVRYGGACGTGAGAGDDAGGGCASRALMTALRLNAAQVRRYLRTYSAAARALPADAQQRNDAAYAAAEAAAASGDVAVAVELYYAYLRGSVAMCRCDRTRTRMCTCTRTRAAVVPGVIICLPQGAVDEV